MNPYRFFAFSLLGIFLFLQGACGYTNKTVLPRNIKTLHVNTFQNKVPLGNVYAYEPGVEIKVTNAIIRRLHQDGNLKVVESEKADALLEGDLVALDQEGVRFSGLEQIQEYRLYLVVALRLRDRKTGEMIWEEENFSGDASYFVLGPRAVSRGEAVDKAIERLAHNVVDRIAEDW